jgi:hypothetical protein
MDLKASDDTDPNRVRRMIRTVNGRKVKTRIYFELSGAERIPQKSIIRSRYRVTMWDYWETGDPRIRERAERMSKYVKSPDPE